MQPATSSLTTDSGIEVLSPDGGLWVVIPVPGLGGELHVGRPDGHTLYITAGEGLYRVTLPNPGALDQRLVFGVDGSLSEAPGVTSGQRFEMTGAGAGPIMVVGGTGDEAIEDYRVDLTVPDAELSC